MVNKVVFQHFPGSNMKKQLHTRCRTPFKDSNAERLEYKVNRAANRFTPSLPLQVVAPSDLQHRTCNRLKSEDVL